LPHFPLQVKTGSRFFWLFFLQTDGFLRSLAPLFFMTQIYFISCSFNLTLERFRDKMENDNGSPKYCILFCFSAQDIVFSSNIT